MINPSLHRYSFWRINNRHFLKTLREKEKFLITSNFSFCHNVFFVHVFYIISLFAAELEEPKIGISDKGLGILITRKVFDGRSRKQMNQKINK